MHAGSSSDVGHVRRRNEDALLVRSDDGVFAVADGLGGHVGGDVASALAVESLAELVVPDAEDLSGPIAEALRRAHGRVAGRAAEQPDLTGMGTTAVLAVVRDQDAWVGHVGDSRAYLLTHGRLSGLTRDHSRMGYITQALGLNDVQPEVTPVELGPGDRLLLCTDGLTNMVDEPVIAELAAAGGPQEAADALVRAALDQGGVDNVTVVVIER